MPETASAGNDEPTTAMLNIDASQSPQSARMDVIPNMVQGVGMATNYSSVGGDSAGSVGSLGNGLAVSCSHLGQEAIKIS